MEYLKNKIKQTNFINSKKYIVGLVKEKFNKMKQKFVKSLIQIIMFYKFQREKNYVLLISC